MAEFNKWMIDPHDAVMLCRKVDVFDQLEQPALMVDQQHPRQDRAGRRRGSQGRRLCFDPCSRYGLRPYGPCRAAQPLLRAIRCPTLSSTQPHRRGIVTKTRRP